MRNKIFKSLVIALSLIFVFKGQAQKSYFELSKNMEIFMEMYKQIDIFYVDETKPGELMKIGMDAMLESLDPYTVYIPESDIEDYRFMTTGEYGGIGAVIRRKDDYTMVVEPYENFPAQKAGLHAGDIILEIDGKSIEGLSTEEVSSRLKGQKGTEVKLKIKRADQELDKTLVREEVKIESVPYYGMLNESTGYIKLTGFTQTAGDDVKKAYEALKEKGMENLIFDLRGNGGGLLRESVKIVNFFVEKGQEVVSTKGRIEEANNIYKATEEPLDPNIPVVVLVNGGSASASEIVSGALQDLDRGVVIGQTTYGKGLVQQTKDLEYNSKLKLTIAKYYTPSGRCIQKLNYTHQKDKNAEEIPDSLIQTFKTKNGRVVKDGRGVDPDIMLPRRKYARITASLVVEDLIFDFATDYFRKKPEAPDPKKFTFTDQDFKKFKSFIEEKDFHYNTASQEEFKRMKKIAEREGYYKLAESEFDNLIAKLAPDEDRDLELFKDEIKQILQDEIITRYHYQEGRIVNGLENDEYIKEALEVLNNKERYNGILDGSIPPVRPDDEVEGVEELDIQE